MSNLDNEANKNKLNIIGILFLCDILLSLFAGIIVAPIFHLFNIEHLLRSSAFNMLFSAFFLFFPALIYLIINRKTAIKNLRIKPINIVLIILSIIFTYTMLPIMSFVNMLSQLFVKVEIQKTVDNMVNNLPFLATFIILALLPAVTEEILCRGIFFNSSRKLGICKAALISALIFGCIHMNFNQFLYAFLMGFAFSLLVEATDSLLSSMISHFVVNATTVILYYSKNFKELVDSQDETVLSKPEIIKALIQNIPIVLVSTAIAFVIFVAIANISGRWQHLKKNFFKNIDLDIYCENENSKIFNIPMIIALLLSFSCMIILTVAN